MNMNTIQATLFTVLLAILVLLAISRLISKVISFFQIRKLNRELQAQKKELLSMIDSMITKAEQEQSKTGDKVQ